MPWGTTNRSAREVVAILEQFLSGEPTGFLADDFICMPITDARLDKFRDLFDQLADQHPQWEPQQPFPEAGRGDLRALIERARSLDL